ncbi:MAG: non-hydrolyzing UDP-N-acetylglucosamine 2-epimerase [Nitrospinota bacterium]
MNRKIKILNVVGARPNFMKIAPLSEVMEKRADQIEPFLVHTGQHYDKKMSKAFFDHLDIPRPDLNLEVGSGSHAEQTAEVMVKFEKVLLEKKPDLLLVVGDINSTLACSVTAAKLSIPVAHVEAGLRSRDKKMPEEINRLVTDTLSDYLFTTCREANTNLEREGVEKSKIFFVGNVMIDTLLKHKKKAGKSQILQSAKIQDKSYGLVTLHRPSNVDDRVVFSGIISALKELSKEIPILFPVHPRTRKQLEKFNLLENFKEAGSRPALKGLFLMEPAGYLDFLHLMDKSALLLTDSGGIQEESTILQVPCLTLRENTERAITIREGTNILVGTDPQKIVSQGKIALSGTGKKGKIPELWDGLASERIVSILCDKLL